MPPATASPVLRIAVDIPLRKTFDYCLPSDYPGAIPMPGSRIHIPFGNKQALGILLSVHYEEPDYKLKAIQQVIDHEPVLDSSLLDLLAWAASYYCHPIGEVLFAALPAHLRQGKAATLPVIHHWIASSSATQLTAELSRAPKQQAILDYLREHPEGRSDAELNARFINWRAPIKSLLGKQLVIKQQITLQSKPPACKASDHILNMAQQDAMNTVVSQLGKFASFLLFGVTGSGKTEVYLQIARRVLEQGQQVLILVPEIGLTPQLATHLKERFSSGIAIMHSGLNDSERLEAWLQARSGDARIIVGTRSAVYAPLRQPGIIIVDEEHDASFKQMEGFRYSARDTAIKRAALLGIPVLLGSATPSIESFNNTQLHRSKLLQLPERAGNANHPDIHLIDLRGSTTRSGIANHTLNAIRDELKRGGQALIFLNRRGYAPMLRCESCGWVAECHHCDVRMTLHRRHERLRCHVCSHESRIPKSCPECAANSLKTIGQGTEKLEEALQSQFPDVDVIRVDRDSTRNKGAFEKIINAVHSGEKKILIGTQMLAKGHHFPQVGTVAILDADNGLYGLDFRSQELMAQLITQVAGRAGRASRQGNVYIQTWHPEHPFFSALKHLPYHEFATQLLAERKLTNMPPYSYLVLLRAESAQMPITESFIHQATQSARELQTGSIEILGPAVAPLERKAGFYRMQLLIKANERARLHQFLAGWVDQMDKMKSGRRVRWSVDIDPYNLY